MNESFQFHKWNMILGWVTYNSTNLYTYRRTYNELCGEYNATGAKLQGTPTRCSLFQMIMLSSPCLRR
jgi:hypothetical protein